MAINLVEHLDGYADHVWDAVSTRLWASLLSELQRAAALRGIAFGRIDESDESETEVPITDYRWMDIGSALALARRRFLRPTEPRERAIEWLRAAQEDGMALALVMALVSALEHMRIIPFMSGEDAGPIVHFPCSTGGLNGYIQAQSVQAKH